MKNSTNTLNVIIAGSRNFDDYQKLESSCDNILKSVAADKQITVFSGGAGGTDTLGEQYAQARGYQLRRFPADWEQYGKAAGPVRNHHMAKEADMVICFWNGLSKGTRHMISTAKKLGLELHVIPVT